MGTQQISGVQEETLVLCLQTSTGDCKAVSEYVCALGTWFSSLTC